MSKSQAPGENGVAHDENLRVRIDLGYDGTNFSGWGVQPGLRTVQGTVEEALSTLLRTERLPLTVAGRTDAGVHALNQTAHFDMPRSLSRKIQGETPERFKATAVKRLNGVLLKLGAEDIVVKNAYIVSDKFDARFSALERHYEYRLRDLRGGYDPLSRLYAAYVKSELDLDLMRAAAAKLTGLNDFGAFCKPREGATSIRELKRFSWECDRETFIARLSADAFCHSMVRNLVGAVVEVGSGRLKMAEFEEIFQSAERTSKIHVMPPNGLFMVGVDYPEEDDFETRAQATRAKRAEFSSR